MFFGPTKGVTKLLVRSLDAITKRLQARPVGDTPIVAWHEVPGKASSKEPFRRVRYDRAQDVLDRFVHSCVHSVHSQESHRDG